jgi:hypothetical protein
MDVWEYFGQKEREFRELSLVPDRDFEELFAEAAGSNGRRGRIFGNLNLTDNAFLAVSELVIVAGSHIRRLEYGYFLVIDGEEIWGYERDPTHSPTVHRHIQGHRREECRPVAFKMVVDLAWREISRRATVS